MDPDTMVIGYLAIYLPRYILPVDHGPRYNGYLANICTYPGTYFQ